MNAHSIPRSLDAILDEQAAIISATSKGINAVAQRAVEGRAAADRKQVARPGRAA
jgi:hypothetical protein